MFLLLALLIGVISGLRTMTAPAAVAWGAALGWFDVSQTPLAFMGYRWTPWIFTVLAIVELIADQLPSTPSRKVPMQFGARIVSGALAGATIWITGLRRGQSANRAETPFAEYDAERHLLKVNPLADWDLDVIKAYVADNGVPINPLHARGYPSIGCEPCTRAIKPGEPERAGRWWWEQDEKRECGLHVAEEASAIAAQQ